MAARYTEPMPSAAEVPEGSPEVLTAKQAAAFIGISRPNLDKWLAHRGIEPHAVAPHPVGRLYRKDAIEAARDRWLEERNREADEKRRTAAMKNITG